MNILHITIPGKPIAKQRARKKKHNVWYNPQSDIMNQIKLLIKNQLPDNFKMIPKGNPVKLDFMFFFNPIKSQKKINEFDPYIKKPDIDNLSKFILDIMSKIVFYDDNQCYCQGAEKRYTLKNARTEVEIIW